MSAVGEDAAGGTVAKHAPAEINTSVAHPARVYDYWRGGKDNCPADRRVAEQVIDVLPSVEASARANRAFMVRAARFLAAEAGITQFLDIGTGIPTSPNLHEVVQAIAPRARVVYTDNDPIVLVHACALLTSGPEGRTGYVDADVRDPARILREAAGTLDLRQPVALLLVAILQYVTDEDDPWGIVRELVAGVPSGSCLVVSHPCVEAGAPRAAAGMEILNRLLAQPVTPRGVSGVARFFDGLELVPPGLVVTTAWRPEPGDDGNDPIGEATMLCGVARKP